MPVQAGAAGCIQQVLCLHLRGSDILMEFLYEHNLFHTSMFRHFQKACADWYCDSHFKHVGCCRS